MKKCYNASKSHESVRFARISQVSQQKDVTPEEEPIERCDPTCEKGKRKVEYNLGKEKICKMKADPIILKATIATKKKRKKSM